MTNEYESWERSLQRLGRERNRENFIRILYDQLPEEWDEDAEEQLPPDLRLDPAPSVPFPILN